ncbi:unnamed protein product [Paramecium sonneborni]|uniref:Uncharacterized protein n=1 Tax=Paramecium sonneborni TaxID=65129 RepID=A0A8S1RDT2_9CILI|nr:unnamed protein product [Paramecium sonneborni]
MSKKLELQTKIKSLEEYIQTSHRQIISPTDNTCRILKIYFKQYFSFKFNPYFNC